MLKLIEAVLTILLLGSIVYTTGWVYQQKHNIELADRETHPLCKDTPTKTAWVAYKNGKPRCFLENNKWPNRAHGSNIDVGQE